jgi:hypothetical protein
MWKVIAEAIAREANYRAQREMSRRNLTIMTAGSILRFNIFIILILSSISGMMGLASLEGREAALLVSIPLFILEIMMGTLSMALSLQAIVSDKLLEPIQHLPIEERDLRKALSLLGIYWGGLALPFTMIPAGLISSIVLSDPSILAGYLAASITGMILSLALGYLVGSIAGKYTRSLSRRAISTLLWTILIGFGFFLNAIMRTFSPMEDLSALNLLKAVPPLSFLDWSLTSLISSSLTFALSLALLAYGTSRFWRAAISPGEAAPVSSSWNLSFGVKSIVMKDIRIALRNPRMLATLIVDSIALPLFLISSMIEGFGKLDSTALVISISLGVLQAAYSSYPFYLLDSSGARALYTLPISRREVASMKTLSLLTFNSIPFILISMGLIYLGIWASIPAYLMALAGSGYLNCLIYAKMLPKEPANWSVETFERWIITIILMIQTIFFISLVIISQFFPIFALWLSSLSLIAVYGASLYLSHEMRGEPL